MPVQLISIELHWTFIEMEIKDMSVCLCDYSSSSLASPAKAHWPGSAHGHTHIQGISFGDSAIIFIVRFVPIKPQQGIKKIQFKTKQLLPCHTGAILIKGQRDCATFQTPAVQKTERKKGVSLVDKSSFSSWLHTAAGGLTCHRRIQPLIYLCFPQVFLNFTHSSRAISESEPGFLCQPRRRVHGLSSLRQIGWSESHRAAHLFALCLAVTGRRRICHFQAYLFTFQFRFEPLPQRHLRSSHFPPLFTC